MSLSFPHCSIWVTILVEKYTHLRAIASLFLCRLDTQTVKVTILRDHYCFMVLEKEILLKIEFQTGRRIKPNLILTQSNLLIDGKSMTSNKSFLYCYVQHKRTIKEHGNELLFYLSFELGNNNHVWWERKKVVRYKDIRFRESDHYSYLQK